MKPAYSIVFFTVASGAGYGLLALAGLFSALGLLPGGRWFGLAALGLALAFIALGLVASTFHLRHPERAWRALGQWRSSWLSREGALALLTFAPALGFGAGWVVLGETGGIWRWLGLAAAAGAALTVFCTGMIYASLKPVRQWHQPLTVPVYLSLALASGALWLNALAAAFGASAPWLGLLVFAALLQGWLVKLAYWHAIDKGTAASTPESATGLGPIGKVRLLDPPHTGGNYLLSEMGYRVARKHAAKLRRLALLLGGILPALLTLPLFVLDGLPGALMAFAAALAALAGLLVERWLFFAEAKHAVTLYYGAGSA